MKRIPDPSWKSGPPDPPRWMVHEHEFYYAEPYVEVIDGYVYVHQQCEVTDGHPYDPQRCEAQRTIVYRVDGVEQLKHDHASREWVGGEVEPGSDVYQVIVRKSEREIREDPFQYDVLEEGDFEVWVKYFGTQFAVRWTHDDTEVREW